MWPVTRFCGALLALLSVAMSGLAQNPGVEKFKDYTPEQIKAIPDKERQRSVPMMYIFAAQKALAPDAKLAITMDLNVLMYPGVGDYAAAIKMFQKDVGAPATGVLTVSQIHKLTIRAEYQRLAPVGFPTPNSSDLAVNLARVSGTWKIIDDDIAWPVNYVTLSCNKSENYCEMRTTHLSLPKDDDWVRTYALHEPFLDFYRITRWDSQIIEAVPWSEQGRCRTSTLSLNFKTREFYEITKNAGGNCEAFGVSVPKLDKPRISQIVDGKEIVERSFRAIQKKAYGFLASSFRMQVEKAGSGLEGK